MTKKIGKYEIIKQIGSGAMGAVYEGIDPLIQRKVAIKTLRNEFLTSDDDSLLKRFQQEAQAIGQLHHPNIVAIFEYGEDEDIGGYFIAMTYVEGKDLKECFDSKHDFSLENVCNILIQLLDALGFTHKLHIYHRDIKPSNLILKSDGSVMVTDFGIASLESSDLTQDSTLMGTPSYMSPEQLKGQTVDGRTDLYSTAVILYQFLTGEKPFQGSTIAAIYHKILEVEPTPPSTINGTLPESFDRIIQKGLAKNREERYSSAKEFKQDIQRELDSLISAKINKETALDDIALDDSTVVLPMEEIEQAITIDSMEKLVDNDATTYLAPDEYAAELDQSEIRSTGSESTIVTPRQESAPNALDNKNEKAQVQGSKYSVKVVGSIGLIVSLMIIGVSTYFLKGNSNVKPDQPLVISDPGRDGGDEKALPTTTEVSINTHPSEAKVFLDDIEQNSLTNYKTQLDAQPYLLSIRKEGYHEVVVVLDVKAGKPVNLDIELHPF